MDDKHQYTDRSDHLRAQLLETERATQVNPVWVDEQGNENEMNEHGVDNENAHTVGEQMDVQTAKGVREPRQPTEKERSEHSLTHVPFSKLLQSLCPGTFKGKSSSTTDIVREKAQRQDHNLTGLHVSLG